MRDLLINLAILAFCAIVGIVTILLWLAPSSCPNAAVAILNPAACEIRE